MKTIAERIASLGWRVNNIRMSQIRLASRFRQMDRLVMDAGQGYVHPKDCKNIYKVAQTDRMDIHDWHGTGRQCRSDITDICFNHYALRADSPKPTSAIDNIHPALKERVRQNSRDYLRVQAPCGMPYAHCPGPQAGTLH